MSIDIEKFKSFFKIQIIYIQNLKLIFEKFEIQNTNFLLKKKNILF